MEDVSYVEDVAKNAQTIQKTVQRKPNAQTVKDISYSWKERRNDGSKILENVSFLEVKKTLESYMFENNCKEFNEQEQTSGQV